MNSNFKVVNKLMIMFNNRNNICKIIKTINRILNKQNLTY